MSAKCKAIVVSIKAWSEERRVGTRLRTGLETGGRDPVTDGALLVVVLLPLVVTHGLVVQGTDTPAADNSLAVFHFLGLFLRFLRVLVQADISLAVQRGFTEFEGLQ